jgi:hypothetical protein
MCPFEWLTQEMIEEIEKRRFHGVIETVGDEKTRTFTVSLSWTDKLKGSGQIFIPVEGIKKMYAKIVDLENYGFKEEMGQQIYPP